ncbi:hypothetical protein MYAER_3061 [Microcystis aeruginosa NIES-2549]|uniref:Uncharacterized protein n=1 Tax=Microcystis aeruginosa NIES-2549 TaxID=1641812 RepID=A0A0F6U616_MICAE|nr:hypothetical protein [Microcystis aeruginosa]AKE65401.1 hypothetical protein MYAER_3061 [Microcystis aeruginosa NIES-2549]AOC53811.1 hypothetical protein amyaer_3104 [Microcystis aeruginosa NIES-2481]
MLSFVNKKIQRSAREEDVKNAIFIGATGITPEQKQDLIRRGAIFGDTSNDRSKVLV